MYISGLKGNIWMNSAYSADPQTHNNWNCRQSDEAYKYKICKSHFVYSMYSKAAFFPSADFNLKNGC